MSERLGQSEETNKQLVGQVNFLGKTNESLMEEIDDSNERMSAELATCRQGRDKAETRCTVLPPVCNVRDKAETRCTVLPPVCHTRDKAETRCTVLPPVCHVRTSRDTLHAARDRLSAAERQRSSAEPEDTRAREISGRSAEGGQ